MSATKLNIQQFAQNQLKYIQSEQDTEIQETEESFRQLSDKQLQQKGLCLYGLRLASIKSGIGGSTLIQFEAGIGGLCKLPETNKIRVGDVVSVVKHGSSKKDDFNDKWNLNGTITRVTDQFITVSIKSDLPNDLPDLFKLSKLANSVSYKRMQNAMNLLEKQHESLSDLTGVLFGGTIPSISLLTEDVQFYDETLNEPQRKAVMACLQANELSLIHGPPGTGKTHTCVEVIRQLASRMKKRILVCGPSNISVDNLVERLSKCKLDIVRIGHPSRVLNSVIQYALDVRLYSSEEGQIVNQVKSELDATLGKAAKAKRKGDRHALYQEAKKLRQELRLREKTVLESTIRNAQVILCTLNGAASRVLAGEVFDVVMIDEASQALEAESWIAIQKGAKLILAGDHLQLPPTIQSKGPIQKALSFTLFERILNMHGEKIKTLLNIQYRMNEMIMNFSSDFFYDGKLVCGPGVGNRLLTDLEGIKETDETEVPLVFIDTSNDDFIESCDEEDSIYNQGEIDLVIEYVQLLVKGGVKDSDIVVISPYNAQISRLKLALKEEFPLLETGTVDGIQGREKECVVLSLVRSNSRGEVGFLSESRRLNVAITRPKRHLCIIGDSQTLKRDKCLKQLMEYIEVNGEIRYPT